MSADSTHERNLDKLRRDFGPVFLAALADPETVEICLNADGTLWQECLGQPLKRIGTMASSAADAAMRTLAAYHHTVLTRDNPSIECELPLDGSRFAGQIPPIVPSPVFAVRKRASRVFTLQQYVEAGIMTPAQKSFLCGAIRDHRNILVSGGTGSGKNNSHQRFDSRVNESIPERAASDHRGHRRASVFRQELRPVSHQPGTRNDAASAHVNADAA
jgi:Flp pilus assembly CpaF family ATPase